MMNPLQIQQAIAGGIAAIAVILAVVLGAIGGTWPGKLTPADPAVTPAAVTAQTTAMENEQAVKLTDYEKVDEDTVRVFFPTGNPQCFGYRAEVTEATTSIKIKVMEGTLAGAPEVCTLIAGAGYLDVDLAAPIGARLVLPA